MFGEHGLQITETLRNFTSRFEILVGLISLGLAAALLRFYLRKQGLGREANPIMQVTAALAGATTGMLLSRRFKNSLRKTSS